MKKSFRILSVFMLIGVMVLGLTACGVDMDKVKGTWRVDTINDTAIADFAAQNGVGVDSVMKVVKITDETVTMDALVEGSVQSISGETVVRSNGVEATMGGALFGFEFDEDKNTLSYTIEANGATYKYVFVKEDYDLNSLIAPAVEYEEGGEDEYYEEEE